MFAGPWQILLVILLLGGMLFFGGVIVLVIFLLTRKPTGADRRQEAETGTRQEAEGEK